MNYLYIINAVVWFACAVSILIATLRIERYFRPVFLFSVVICLYYAGCYASVSIGLFSSDNLAIYTRPVSGLIGMQLATLAWIFAISLKRGPHG